MRARKTASAAGMRLGFPPPRFTIPPPAVATSPRSSMSDRVPDSPVNRFPNAESFISVRLPLPSDPSPLPVASSGEAAPVACKGSTHSCRVRPNPMNPWPYAVIVLADARA